MTEEERRQREMQAYLQSRNIFSMMGSGQNIGRGEYDRLKGNPIYNVDKQSGTMFGSVNPHGNMGVKHDYEIANVNPGAAYNSPGAPIAGPSYDVSKAGALGGQGFIAGDNSSTNSNLVVPNRTGLVPTNTESGFNTIQPTNAVSDAPKRNLDFNKYSKSMDKTFMMAALQSAIPKNDQTPARQAPSSGGRGGGNRMDQLTPYASAIKLDDENYPSLWRYS